jgi:CRP-like cAMP-binding protein
VPEGKRQIFSFHIPGDIPDLQSLFIQTMDHTLGAVVRSSVVLIRHEVVRNLLANRIELAAILWRDTLIDASVFREWMMGIGRRTSHARIAHLFCEIVTRMHAVGLANSRECSLPITHLDVADALGLTDVHVCRILKDLREDGLVEFRRGVVNVLNWEGLQEAGEFDSAYLHLRTDRVAA